MNENKIEEKRTISSGNDGKKSTTITFRISKKEKQSWQSIANARADGNITKLIKKAMHHYLAVDILDFWANVQKNRSTIDANYLDLMRNQAHSDDSQIIQATWNDQRPKLMKLIVDEYERVMKELTEKFNKALDNFMNYNLTQ